MRSIIDDLDNKILLELDLNCRISCKKLAAKLGVSREVIDYRIKKLLDKGIIKKFAIIIDPTKLGYQMYKFYFKFQNTSQKIEKQIIDWFCDNRSVAWVASCKGKWDLTVTMYAKNILELNDLMSKFDSTFGEYILEREFNVTIYNGIMSKDYLSKFEKRSILLWGNKPNNLSIDKIETDLLTYLPDNGRASTIEIAKQINSTPRIVLSRMKKLKKQGVIMNYSVSLNLNLIGKQFFKSTLYFTNFSDNLRKRFVSFCESCPELIYYIVCMGSWHAEIELIVNDNEQYFKIMDKLREKLPELRGYETVIISKEHKFSWTPPLN